MARLPNQKMKSGKPDKPAYLSVKAAAEWDRIMDELIDSGIQISRAHRSLVEVAATTAVDMADARETIEVEGAYIENEKTGAAQSHPAARRLDTLRRDYIKVLSLLGLRSATAGDGGNAVKPDSLKGILGG
jgi:P27 family predicted phage terminase small subunit